MSITGLTVAHTPNRVCKTLAIHPLKTTFRFITETFFVDFLTLTNNFANVNDEPQHSYKHRMPAQLRFSDVDRFGHVNNSVYFSLFDMCKTRYFQDVMGADIFDRMAPVVVHIEANFISPVLFPDEIVIDTCITKIGTKSFTLMQRTVNKRTDEVKCFCETVMVMMDTATNKSVEIDEEFRTRALAFENQSIV